MESLRPQIYYSRCTSGSCAKNRRTHVHLWWKMRRYQVSGMIGKSCYFFQKPEVIMTLMFLIQIYSRDGETKVGKISKNWAGLLREGFTDADVFGISFPMDLDVKMKAVMLGACFLIVSEFIFESKLMA